MLHLHHRPGPDRTAPNIAFLLIGGQHQMLHLAPVAAAIARQNASWVTAFVRNEADAAALREIWPDLSGAINVEILPLPLWARPLRASIAAADQLKAPRLVAARRRLATFDLVVAAERTSTLLKRLPGAKPYLVHIPHGAGDRAQGFERRIALFDHVIVAGSKDRDRMVAERLVREQDCSVSGYIKLAAVQRTAAPRPRLFDNKRVTILYNPHFSATLSSWRTFAEGLIGQVMQDDRFNLIVAPHVRLQEHLCSRERARFEAKREPGRIIVDFGSARSNDMSYTEAADLYVGDVSSQVYEFVRRPRPCVFLNTGASDWKADPSFACWAFGEVIDDPEHLYGAIRRALACHPGYARQQQEGADAALGADDGLAIDRAAGLLLELAGQRKGSLPRAWQHILYAVSPAAAAAAMLGIAIGGGLAFRAAIDAEGSSTLSTGVTQAGPVASLTRQRVPLLSYEHVRRLPGAMEQKRGRRA